jgi:hypothetical protein
MRDGAKTAGCIQNTIREIPNDLPKSAGDHTCYMLHPRIYHTAHGATGVSLHVHLSIYKNVYKIGTHSNGLHITDSEFHRERNDTISR